MNLHAYDPIVAAARRVFPAPLERARSTDLSLRQFVRDAWHILEPRTPFVPGFHLDMICDHLSAITDGRIRNLLINIPPRRMKSLAICVFWPVWEWINHPHRRWLFASYAQSLSTRDSVRCRRLIESNWFQIRFGDRFALRGDQNTKERFETDKGGCRIATSTGGVVTGEGGDRIVVDDPHNIIDSESNLARAAALTWWDQTMSTRLNDPKTGAKVIVMQRIHEKDLSGHILEQGGYVHLCLPAEYEPDRKCITPIGADWRTKEGQLLWPARIGQTEIAGLKRALGPTGFAGQFQQRPVPVGGAVFEQAWFRYFSVVDVSSETKMRRHGNADDIVSPAPGTPGEGRGGGLASDVSASTHPSLPSAPSLTLPRSTERGDRTDASRITYCLFAPKGETQLVAAADCRRFAIMDPAGTESGESTNACYTVIQVWDLTPHGDMLLIHQYRQQVQAPDATAAAIRISRAFNCEFIGIEKDGLGLGIVQTVKRSSVTVRAIKARGSKEARAQIAQIRMHNGQIYFPRNAPFLAELESELLQFPRSQYADQVDALSHAALLVARLAGPAESEITTEARSHGGALELQDELGQSEF